MQRFQIAVANEHDVNVEKVVVVDDSIVFNSGSKLGDGFSGEIVAVNFVAAVAGTTFNKNYIVKSNPGGVKGEMLTTVTYGIHIMDYSNMTWKNRL